MTSIYDDSLKILFTDTLYLLEQIKTYKLYDCKRLIYKNNYFFGIIDKYIQSYTHINDKVLRVHFVIHYDFPSDFLPKKYNPEALTKFNYYGEKCYLYKNVCFNVFRKNYNKQIIFPDLTDKYYINFETFINQQIIKRISKQYLNDKLFGDLTNLILSYI